MPRLSLARALSLAALLLAAPAWAPSEAQAGAAEDEASRQLGLARGDLEAGRADRAAQAATSALRLDPTLVEALLVHALALEAQKDYASARALAVAYATTAGETALPEVDELITRVDRAEPVRTRIQHHDDQTVSVRFAARPHVEDPVVHWRVARGEWKQAWMERDDRGEWAYQVTLPNGAAAKLSFWVETGLGEPLMEQDEDGEERPYRLAMN